LASRLWSVLASVNVGLWEWDVVGNRVEWSDRVDQLFGLPPGAFEGTYEAYLALLHPDDLAIVAGHVTEMIEGARDEYEAEHRILWPDGSVHWLGCKA